MRKILVLNLFFSFFFAAKGQYPLTIAAYSQDFNNLGTGNLSGIAAGNLNSVNPSLDGWFFLESGTGANTDITAGTGSSNAGDTYNFGMAAAIDRTLGTLQSGTLIPSYGFYFINNTGSVITSLAINYTGEQWRLGTAGRVDRLDFQYSLDANTLNSGNWINADVLDFTAPMNTIPLGALDGNAAANRTAVSGTIIGLTIPVGSTCFIRWLDFNTTGAEDGTGIDDFSLTASFAPASTDHFRSLVTGDWNLLSTWESSPDAITWAAATSIPDFNANTISIRNGHTVTVNSFPVVDQVVIQNGGVLNYAAGTITIQDGAGDDVDVQNGGIFTLGLTTEPFFGTGTPTVNIATGGILRVSASGLTAVGTGVNANNYIYQHQSILEYTLTTVFGTVGVIYFPNAAPGVIPIFRITQNISLPAGSASTTTFNGIFEANGNITWQNSGNKIFRNGIRGTGNVTADASAASAKFIINGTTAELSGTGALTVPTIGGLEIGTPTIVTMSSNKTVTGNVSLLTASQINLGAFDLTVTGTVTNATVTSYVRTNGTGKLTLNNVASGMGGKLFPIGFSTINPLYIQSVTTTNYSARVVEPITPTIYNSSEAVLRTWYISSPATTPNATISFGYTFNQPTECGPLYNNAGPVEVGVNIANIWNIHLINLVPAAFPLVPGTFIVTPIAPINYFNGTATEFPFVVANNGAILSVDYNIITHAQKINNTGRISWKVFNTDNVSRFEVQRLTGNGSYQTIATINPVVQLLGYDFTDAALPKGTNLYRIKVVRLNERVVFSNTVAIINDTNGLLITSLAPNPLQGQAMLTISSAKAAIVKFSVYDFSGKVIKQFQRSVSEGTTVLPVDMGGLAAGIYHVLAATPESKSVFRFSRQ